MWIEFHTELRDHWKINRLKETLQIEYPHALGLVACLWTWAAQQAPDGNLKRFTDAEISAAARWIGDKNLIRPALKAAKLIERNGMIHDWEKHGVRLLLSSRKRLEEFRERKRFGNVSETLQGDKVKRISNPSNLSDLSDPSKDKTITVPKELLSIEVEIQEWLKYKGEKNQRYKPTGLNALWRSLLRIPEGRRADAIQQSMANNYAGIFDKGGNENGNHAGHAAPKAGSPRIVD